MHRKVADLYEYLYIYCGEARGNVLYGTVTPETLTEFQMTEEEAFVLSHKNMIKNTLLSTADGALYGYGNMMEISKENMINFVCSSDMPIIVVKGKNGRCGAAYALLQKVNQKILELGGVILSGQCKKISIDETATIENIEDDKGKTKATQPTGYEAAKISIDFILEDSPEMTQDEQITAMQRLFKAYGQTKANLLEIVNEDCAARGISKVYFKKLGTQNVIAESRRTATLELVAPVIAGITTKTVSASAGSTKKKSSSKAKKKTESNTTKQVEFPLTRKKQNAKAKLMARDLIL